MSHDAGPDDKTGGLARSASAIFVGIDPGLDSHGVAALVSGSCYRLFRRPVPNTVLGMRLLATLLTEWRSQAGGRLTVGIEEASAYGEAVEYFLRNAGFSVVVVSAFKVARFKEALGTDGNDLVDAEAVARVLMVQPDLGRAPARQATEADPHGSKHRQLRSLSRRHGRWTREQTAVGNELHAVLRMAWLADYQRFFSRINGRAALAFWQKYPTPGEAAVAAPSEIADLLVHASRGAIGRAKARQKAQDIHRTAKLLVMAFGRHDPQRWVAWAEDIRLLAEHLTHLARGLDQLERHMKALLAEIRTPLTSFKGLGTVTAAVIHGEMLSVERFPTADHFARYNGTAPREESSGRHPRHVKNVRCNKRLKQALMQLALNAPRYHQESQRYLDHLAARGITGGAARLRLARRLSDVLYAMLKHNRGYDLNYHKEKKQSAA